MATEDNDRLAANEGPTYAAAYRSLLLRAISALTDAARLPRPRRTSNDDGTGQRDPDIPADQTDWAEFVTLALAGAAANVGGIEASLAGRSGSWEAEGVRELLHSTVGTDEADLWAHRTEPLEITIVVDEILFDHSNRHRVYDQAQDHLAALYETASKAWDPSHDARHLWIYDRSPDGQMAPRDLKAPPWSEDLRQVSTPGDLAVLNALDAPECEPGTGHHTAYIAKSRQDAAEHRRLVDDYEARLLAIGDLEEQLEAHQLDEWDTYGRALRARLEANASFLSDLGIAVSITIDNDSFRDDGRRHRARLDRLRDRLLEAAISQTPLPHDDAGGLLSNVGEPRPAI